MHNLSNTAFRNAVLVIVLGLHEVAFAQMITGKVTESSQPHKGLADAVVTVKEKSLTAVTKADGTYVINKVGQGVYTLIATKVHYYPSVQESVPSGKRADFELLEIKYGMSGKIIIGDLDEARAKRLLPAAKTAEDALSVYLLSNRLIVAHPSNLTWKLDASAAEMTLRSHPAKILGAVTDTNGDPVPNAEVQVANSGTGDLVATRTNASGQYEVSVFPVGAYALTVHAKGQKQSASVDSIQVQANSSVTMNVSVPEI